MKTLINTLLDREIATALADIKTIAGCMDKERKESRLSQARRAKKAFNKVDR
jgi:hypothetical protein